MKVVLKVLFVALAVAALMLGGCVVRAQTAPPPRTVYVAQPAQAPPPTVVYTAPQPQPARVYVAPQPQPQQPPPPTVVY
jgi:hypothetical protein